MTSRGKLQRIAVNEIGIVGRNTKGVRIMKLDDGDSLSAVVRVPPEEDDPVDESATAPVTSEIVPDDELVDVPEADDARIDNEATDDVGDSNSDNDADSEDDSDSEIEN
jgi:DNA gyrase subunit A